MFKTLNNKNEKREKTPSPSFFFLFFFSFEVSHYCSKKGTTTKKHFLGVKESIMTVTAGIEIYNLSTGELYYTNVYTYGSKVKRDLNE